MTAGARLPRAVATLFGIGYLRPAPGTWASAIAVGLGVMIHGLGSFPLLALATLIATGVGLWAVAAALPGMASEDPSEIVIDELAGQWLTLLAPSFGVWMMGLDPGRLPWPGWVGAFLAFRLFDIWKPWLVGRADAMGGAAGVMLDDLVAAVFAAILVLAAAGLAHGAIL